MDRQPPTRNRPADGASSLADVAIRRLSGGELPAAVAVLARGMRDNPLHVTVFGADPIRRQWRLRRFLGLLLAHVHAHGRVSGAFSGQTLVGVLGMLEPGHCRPPPLRMLRLAGAIAMGNPPGCTLRILHWLSAWMHNDPSGPHWHLGPLAVAPSWRRQGIGRRLMEECCRHLDARGGTAWLETDLDINVAFYETLGFVVAGRQAVLGVPNWFMQRPSS